MSLKMDMTQPVDLCAELIFAIIEHLTDHGDFLAWRQMCRSIELQMTEGLLATLPSPLRLRSVADVEMLHDMTFRGGPHSGGLRWFTGRVELAVGHVPPTHLQRVLDIFELVRDITGVAVRDFDTMLSSFLVPLAPVDSESATVAGRLVDDSKLREAAQEKPSPSSGEGVELSDALARRLLACWARNRALTQFAIDYRRDGLRAVSPCQWRSDAILEKERFPFVTHLSVYFGGKPLDRWYTGWGVAFPEATHLTLSLADDSGANTGQGGGGWQAIRVETEPVQEENAAQRALSEAVEEGEDREEVEREASVQLDEGENEETGGENERAQLEMGDPAVDAEDTVERKAPDDRKRRLAMGRRVPRRGGRADH